MSSSFSDHTPSPKKPPEPCDMSLQVTGLPMKTPIKTSHRWEADDSPQACLDQSQGCFAKKLHATKWVSRAKKWFDSSQTDQVAKRRIHILRLYLVFETPTKQGPLMHRKKYAAAHAIPFPPKQLQQHLHQLSKHFCWKLRQSFKGLITFPDSFLRKQQRTENSVSICKNIIFLYYSHDFGCNLFG